jgi:hypothetical protein
MIGNTKAIKTFLWVRAKLQIKFISEQLHCTWPPLVIENIRVVPPHCFTYHKNHSADTSWGSEVTLMFTKREANSLAVLYREQEQKLRVSKMQCNTIRKYFYCFWKTKRSGAHSYIPSYFKGRAQEQAKS